MQKTTLYLDAALHRQIQELAQRSGRPQAAVIREALERYVTAQDRPLPRSIGAGADGSVGARRSEVWLHTAWSKQRERPDR